MAGKPDAKLKLLYIKEILEKYTDENHILNAAEITEKLSQQYGVECERKSIYKDIDVLVDYGVDIIKTRTPKNGYFVGSRNFELAEIRLLSDAVQAADFITKSKTQKMLIKIEDLASIYQAKALRDQVYIDRRAKCDNEEIFYNIDTLDTAIKSGKKVKLVYTRRRFDDKYDTKKESREFILSPYSLIWSSDHYYLVANNEKYNNLMNMRVDRISKVEILEQQARHLSEVSTYRNSFDAADYSAKTFNMFSGKPESIELKCNNELLEEMIDKFGENCNMRKAEGECFLLRTEACVNDGLVSWIMQFGNKLKAVSPASLREAVKEKAIQIQKIYDI